MTDFFEMGDVLLTLIKRRNEFMEWLPHMDAVLVIYKNEDLFQRFQSDYYRDFGEHYCYTVSQWLELSKEEKLELVNQKVMLIHPKYDVVNLSGQLMFNVKKAYKQIGDQIVTLKDALGITDKRYIPSHSY